MTIELMIGLALVVVIAFTGFKVVETVYIDKEKRAMKLYIRDALYVFLSAFAVIFLYNTNEKHILDFFYFLTDTKNVAIPEKTPIFVGEPGF